MGGYVTVIARLADETESRRESPLCHARSRWGHCQRLYTIGGQFHISTWLTVAVDVGTGS